MIDTVVGGLRVDTVSSLARVGFRFNAVDQHRHPVNRMATLLLLATSELCAREVPLLYRPVLVASHDELGAPAGLSREQRRMLGGGPKVNLERQVDAVLSGRPRRAPAPPGVGP